MEDACRVGYKIYVLLDGRIKIYIAVEEVEVRIRKLATAFLIRL